MCDDGELVYILFNSSDCSEPAVNATYTSEACTECESYFRAIKKTYPSEIDCSGDPSTTSVAFPLGCGRKDGDYMRVECTDESYTVNRFTTLSPHSETCTGYPDNVETYVAGGCVWNWPDLQEYGSSYVVMEMIECVDLFDVAPILMPSLCVMLGTLILLILF
eukprot:CAMPEP_0202707436 /NCGR_PEP_ID=MMETSP1385-20130828/19765_1 /ASSEMBLY_ACC=CAM_ASM_000861 /TAXON_ID=933848 /ORGANISM="Elphidium margaritaceum" /LENGTH=162 /DNA_ID=CAMNT_0049366153 /DNA_START=198 /DNA_END=686 /DNA_ORIENTATION=+